MKFSRVSISASILFFATVTMFAQTAGTDYRRIGASMQKFGNVFKEITNTYVDDVDPLPLVEAGINGMLKYLDPYSTYMRTDETDDIDVLTNGHYIGFGFTVALRDSQLTITDLREGYPAQKAGVRIGDVIAYINENRVDTISPANLRPYSKGPVNTTAKFTLVRRGAPDTIVVSMMRTEIPVENVSLYTLLPNGVGYLKLARFSRSAGKDVREALAALQRQGTVTSFIIDLRDNPGGLLDAAVSIAENFFPRGTLVVSTIGKNGRRADYRTSSEPPFPNLPLAVIVNNRSASASEILAGAVQDLDRGIVVGETSFGKGLVQTVHALPDEGTVKLTSAKYITPSGRNVQKVDYVNRRLQIDSPAVRVDQVSKAEFRTLNGRVIFEHGGITPDVLVADSMLSPVVQHLLTSGTIFNYATRYAAPIRELPHDFSVSKKLLDAFFKYVESEMSTIGFPELKNLASAHQQALKDGLASTTVKYIEQAEKSAESDVWRSIRQNSPVISQLLEIELRVRFGTEKDRLLRLIPYDLPVQKAASMMAPQTYNAILTPHSSSDQ